MIKLFKRILERPKYEFYLFEGNQIMVNRDLKKLQEEGWELAGETACKYGNNSASMNRMLIPLKRRIK